MWKILFSSCSKNTTTCPDFFAGNNGQKNGRLLLTCHHLNKRNLHLPAFQNFVAHAASIFQSHQYVIESIPKAAHVQFVDRCKLDAF